MQFLRMNHNRSLPQTLNLIYYARATSLTQSSSSKIETSLSSIGFMSTTSKPTDDEREIGKEPLFSNATATEPYLLEEIIQPSSPTKSKFSGQKQETSVAKKATVTAQWIIKSAYNTMLKTQTILWFYITDPKKIQKKLSELKQAAVKEAHHYWMGSKLLAADVRTARHIMGRTFRGSSLSRRERKQLLRTVTDVFRLVPMSVFVLIPFMEFALPFALKIFPNMLPSTFQDSLKEEEKMKGELQMRISIAGFFQE